MHVILEKIVRKKLDKNISVRNAALKAADAVPEYCPIRFRGNRNYNGYK